MKGKRKQVKSKSLVLTEVSEQIGLLITAPSLQPETRDAGVWSASFTYCNTPLRTALSLSAFISPWLHISSQPPSTHTCACTHTHMQEKWQHYRVTCPDPVRCPFALLPYKLGGQQLWRSSSPFCPMRAPDQLQPPI